MKKELYVRININMFSVRFEYENIVMITYTDNTSGIIATFIPENPKIIENIDIEGIIGKIGKEEDGGEFSLSWDAQKREIELCCARYGGGNGGDLDILIPYSEETMASLRCVLRKWKEKL